MLQRPDCGVLGPHGEAVAFRTHMRTSRSVPFPLSCKWGSLHTAERRGTERVPGGVGRQVTGPDAQTGRCGRARAQVGQGNRIEIARNDIMISLRASFGVTPRGAPPTHPGEVEGLLNRNAKWRPTTVSGHYSVPPIVLGWLLSPRGTLSRPVPRRSAPPDPEGACASEPPFPERWSKSRRAAISGVDGFVRGTPANHTPTMSAAVCPNSPVSERRRPPTRLRRGLLSQRKQCRLVVAPHALRRDMYLDNVEMTHTEP